MRNLSFIAIGVALFVFTSCSNSIEPETVEINGPLKGCYEVVDKDYKVQKSTKGEEGVDAKKIIVEIKRTSQPFFDISPDNLKIDDGDIIDVADKKVYDVSFGIELLNSDGDVLATLGKSLFGSSENIMIENYSDTVDKLLKLEESETGTIEIHYAGLEEDVAKFRILSAVDERDATEYDLGEGYYAGLPDNDGDESLVSDPYARAEALDEYEELVDQYVKFFEKAEGGDLDALSEYPELLAKAQSAYEALDAVKSELTVDELARLNKIQMKMVNAMQ